MSMPVKGISGGYRITAKARVLNTETNQAIIGGQIKLQDNAVFNANGKSTITGGYKILTIIVY